MTMSLESNESVQVVVIAKYQFYLDDAIEAFRDSGIELILKLSIRDFTPTDVNPDKRIFLFFPHVSGKVEKSILDQFTCIGFHAGDLPKDRGGSPIQNKILKGEYLTKLSAFLMTTEIDAGPIYLQAELDLSEGNIEEMLHDVSKLSARMMFKIANNRILPSPQIGEPSFVRRLDQNDSWISSLDLNPTQLFDRIRMVDGLGYPNARITIDNYDLVFSNASLQNGILTADCAFHPKEL